MEIVERESGCKVKALRSDNGGEYIAMEDFLLSKGHQATIHFELFTSV